MYSSAMGNGQQNFEAYVPGPFPSRELNVKLHEKLDSNVIKAYILKM